MGGEPTGMTEELRLSPTIGLLTMPTGATGLAGIRRVDVDHAHACEGRLIGDEGAKLEKTPTMQHSPLALNRSLRTGSYTLQVFQGNPTRSAFRRVDNRLRQTMVHISRKALFTPAAFSEQAFCRFCTFLLQLLTEAAVAGAYLIDMSVFWARGMIEEFAVRGCCQLDDAQVNTYEVVSVCNRWFRRIYCNRQQKGVAACTVQQTKLSTRALHQVFSIGPKTNGEEDSSIQRQKRHMVNIRKRTDPFVIDHCATCAKMRLSLLVALICFSDLAYGAYGHLRRQTELLTDVVVEELLQFNLVGAPLTKRYASNRIASGIEYLQRPQQGVMLFRCRCCRVRFTTKCITTRIHFGL